MAFIVRQVSRTSDGREIIRPATFEMASIKVGRDAACEIHLPDLAVDLHHAAITNSENRRVSVDSGYVVRLKPSHHRPELPWHEFALSVTMQLALRLLPRRCLQDHVEEPLPNLVDRSRPIDDLAAIDVDVLFLAIP